MKWKLWCAQALIPAEMAACGTVNRFRGKGRQFVAEIGFVERPTADGQRFDAAENAPESDFRIRPEQNQVRVLVARRQERASDFDARMAGLHGLLRKWQIITNESVDVARVGVSA
jgi:hypothetical protein